MNADAVVRARIDTVTKERAAAALEAMGLSVSDAIRLLMLRIADEQRLPFDVIVPTATKDEIEQFAQRLRATPAAYIAQPTLALSTSPTYVESGVAPRHIDLRPYVLCGREISVVPGGLTRVALREGSLVVNSSQGGGTKDTWVLQEALPKER